MPGTLSAFEPVRTDPIGESLEWQTDQLRATGTLDVSGVPLVAAVLVPEIYSRLNFTLAWNDPRSIEELLVGIEASDQHGLEPTDFHLTELRRLASEARSGGSPPVTAQIERDLLLTDSLAHLAQQLRYGKLDPKRVDPGWKLGPSQRDEDLAATIATALQERRIGDLIAELPPKDPVYARLKNALQATREIERRGGWPRIADGQKLEPGMVDERVKVLRRRLQVTGDLPASASASNLYDDTVVAGVKRFQARHGLRADGVVGARTLAALNVPAAVRVDQIRSNLERSRWVLADLTGSYLAVNIAGFVASLHRDGEIVWRTRVIVGKPYRRTPVFRSQMTYLVVNPSWTVPPTILKEDVLPRLRRDASYFERNGFVLVDRDGGKLSGDGMDWTGVSAAAFPYQIMQPPGRKNPLGRLKFMFPNPYQIYLHDTPDRSLFDRAERSFSSGCIRVENPEELARRLLKPDPKWSDDAIDRLLASSKTKTVMLSEPLPVLILYWTAEVDADGTLRFSDDVYDRDAPIAKALKEPSRPRRPFARAAG